MLHTDTEVAPERNNRLWHQVLLNYLVWQQYDGGSTPNLEQMQNYIDSCALPLLLTSDSTAVSLALLNIQQRQPACFGEMVPSTKLGKHSRIDPALFPFPHLHLHTLSQPYSNPYSLASTV